MPSDVTDLTRNQGITELRTRIRGSWDALSPAARDVCRSLSEMTPERLLYLSAIEIGAATGTSNATVVRALQSLGYTGLADLKRAVARAFTDQTAPEVRARRRVEAIAGDLEGVWDRVTSEWLDRIDLMRSGFIAADYARAVELLLSLIHI